MPEKKIMPTTWLMIALIAVIVLHITLPVMTLISWPWNMFGIVPLAFGIIINLMADQSFKKAGTTVKPFQESSSLVAHGVFLISRNPMYLGFLCITAGTAVLLGSILPFAISIALAVLLYKKYITVEERMLAEKFGQSWEEYRKKVGRWL